jgi:hypothetical protein
VSKSDLFYNIGSENKTAVFEFLLTGTKKEATLKEFDKKYSDLVEAFDKESIL